MKSASTTRNWCKNAVVRPTLYGSDTGTESLLFGWAVTLSKMHLWNLNVVKIVEYWLFVNTVKLVNILAKLYLNSVSSFLAENLAVDRNLTRQEITTFLNHTVNLGCYVTNVTEPTNSFQSLSSPVTSEPVVYTWKKDNVTVTRSSRAKIHGNVLVVTPESPKDFGMYECNVTNGVSSTQCRILLIKGLKYELAGEYKTSVLGTE